jgi:hypothetical protein
MADQQHWFMPGVVHFQTELDPFIPQQKLGDPGLAWFRSIPGGGDLEPGVHDILARILPGQPDPTPALDSRGRPQAELDPAACREF